MSIEVDKAPDTVRQFMRLAAAGVNGETPVTRIELRGVRIEKK